MYSKKEIIEALWVIKNICEDENCDTCPFRSVNNPLGMCYIWDTRPKDWTIAPKNELWQAFKKKEED